MGKSLLAGFLLSATLLHAAGLRYQAVCEVENSPTKDGLQPILDAIQGEVLAGPKATLVRGAKRSMLFRVLEDGRAESIEIDHGAKTWKLSKAPDTVQALRASSEKIRGIQTKVTVRGGLPEREIEGYKAKGYGLDVGFDASELIREESLGLGGEKTSGRVVTMMSGTRFSFQTWVTQEIPVPLGMSAASRGVGAESARLDIFMRQFLARAEGGADAFAKLSQVGEGFTLETVLEMEIPFAASPNAGNGKPVRIKILAKDVKQGEIDEKEFAIPEGYRKVE